MNRQRGDGLQALINVVVGLGEGAAPLPPNWS
jgi:hypothetical protein